MGRWGGGGSRWTLDRVRESVRKIEVALKRSFSTCRHFSSDRLCYTNEYVVLEVVRRFDGSSYGKSSGNAVNRIIIFGVPECVYIDIEIPHGIDDKDDVDDARERLLAKTCMLACESCD